jgi:hypothetical protein
MFRTIKNKSFLNLIYFKFYYLAIQHHVIGLNRIFTYLFLTSLIINLIILPSCYLTTERHIKVTVDKPSLPTYLY